MTRYIVWDLQLDEEKDIGVDEGFETAEQAGEHFKDYWSDIVFDCSCWKMWAQMSRN